MVEKSGQISTQNLPICLFAGYPSCRRISRIVDLSSRRLFGLALCLLCVTELGLVVPADGQVASQSRPALALALLARSADAGDPLASCLRRCARNAHKLRGANGLVLPPAPDCAGRATVRHFAPACARQPRRGPAQTE
jgi:hypothetical protein